MHKKLAIIYFNLSILIIKKLTLNSVDPFLLETSHLPPFPFPQGGKAWPVPSLKGKCFRQSCPLLPLWGRLGKGV